MTAHGQRRVPVFVALPPRTMLLDVAGPIEVLRKANLEQSAVRFDVRYVGPSSNVSSSVGLTLAGIEPLPERLPDDAFVILSGNASTVLGEATSSPEDDAAAEDRIVDWLKAVVRPGHRLISICSGALLAGRAGLLDGYACTTHHSCCADLAALAPRATVLENRLHVEDRDRLSSAGVTAGIDLMLQLVARMAGPACAVAVARYLVVYLRRGGSDPQLSPWLEGRNHIHPAVHRAQDAVAAEPARPWSLDEIAVAAGASPRHLSRLFNEHAAMSVTDYVNRMRIALAGELLGQTRLDIENVAERSGFGSTRQFRRAWNRFHDLPPSRARRSAMEAAPGTHGSMDSP